MGDMRLGSVETRFAQIIWENAPVSTGELVKLAQEVLSWKRTTTYTVLKRLCEKGLFRTENSVVEVVIDRDAFYSRQSEEFVQESFGGSLPAFLAAFSRGKKLGDEEIDELQKLIDQHRRG